MIHLSTLLMPLYRATKIHLGVLVIALSFTIVGVATAETPAKKPSQQGIKLMCGSVGMEHTHCQNGAKRCSKKLGFEITPVPAVNGSNERLAQYGQFFAAGSSDVDVFQVDVTWPGLLAPYLIDLNPYVTDADRQAFIPALKENNTVNGKFLALPWYMETGVLYYRKDLLAKYKRPVPTTWDDLFETAKIIQDGERKAGNKNSWGYVFQGKAYEGLTVNATEWIHSTGKSHYTDKGAINFNNPEVKDLVTLIASNVGVTIPKGVMNYNEEEARGAFQSGNAILMRNWPYAWKLANAEDSPIKGKVGLAMLPKASNAGGRPASVLGGWQLGVSKFSKHPEMAAKAVLCMTGEEEQRQRALDGGYTPTRVALHTEPAVKESSTYLKHFGANFDQVVARPSRITQKKYSQFSNAVWTTINGLLNDGKNAEKTIERKFIQLEKKVKLYVRQSV